MNESLSWLKDMNKKCQGKAACLKKELRVVCLAYRRPGVPWYAKLAAALVVGYALSPVDLIPDFIPVFGYLDDLLLIPLGIALIIKLMPESIIAECRLQADETSGDEQPENWVAGGLIILFWLGLIIYLGSKLFGR